MEFGNIKVRIVSNDLYSSFRSIKYLDYMGRKTKYLIIAQTKIKLAVISYLTVGVRITLLLSRIFPAKKKPFCPTPPNVPTFEHLARKLAPSYVFRIDCKITKSDC